MKKFLACACVIFLALVSFFCAFAAEESAPQKERVTLSGIITSVTDADGDGLLDKGGSVGIMLLTGGRAHSVNLTFTEDEFDDMALTSGAEKEVDVSVRAYAVNAVVSAEYLGDAALPGKDYFEKSDEEKIKKCLLDACRKNGEDIADTVLPKGNEVYSTYVSDGENAGALSFSYDEESGTARIIYKGNEYTAAKKIGGKNKIVITESGTALPLSEVKCKIKAVTEGEMLALFGDVDGDGLFDVMDIKSYSAFAPISAEWNAAAGVRGKAFSYVLFDRELRSCVPEGRTFSAKNAEGAGLSLLLANENGEARLFTHALCRNGEGGYTRFVAVRNAKITSAEIADECVKVTFEGGETVILPTAVKEEKAVTVEIFFEVSGEVGSKTVKINSWFGSLAEFYRGNGAATLEGKTATAVFGADGKAVYFEINE